MKTIDISTLKIDPKELKQRLLGADDSETLKKAQEFESIIKSLAECKYEFNKTTVNTEGDKVVFGFYEVESSALAKNLADCSSAYIVAVTLGHSVDRLLRQEAVKSSKDHFIADAVASSLIEAVCNRVQELLPGSTKPRFSAGYGDLSLDFQKPILSFLRADGITLTESSLMIPTKSITFIAGRK